MVTVVIHRDDYLSPGRGGTNEGGVSLAPAFGKGDQSDVAAAGNKAFETLSPRRSAPVVDNNKLEGSVTQGVPKPVDDRLRSSPKRWNNDRQTDHVRECTSRETLGLPLTFALA